MVRAFLLIYLRTWDDGGRLSFLNVVRPPPMAGPDDDCERLRIAYETAAELAALGLDDLADDFFTGLGERLDWLAGDLRAQGKEAEAAALWLPAAQLTPDPARGADYASRAALAASRAGRPETLAAAASVRAIRLHRAAVPAIELFDAVDVALRHLAACEQPDEEVFGQLGLAVRAVPALEPLLPIMLPVFTLLRGAPDDQQPIELVRPTWARTLPELVDVLSKLRPALTAELARERLGDDDADDALVLASWATWSFDHPSYRRAVPHGASLARERDADLARLVLRHESTHIASMIGGLGLAIMALRAAAVELELDLWALSQKDAPAEFVDRGVATLGDRQPLAVAVAEWQIELLAKVQILQDVWNPWFEGIAVFGELSDDPTADDRDMIVGDLMSQLIDVPREGESSAAERRAAYAADRVRLEHEFAEAQARLGPERLQYYYWETAGPKYIGGYLAVRSVIASWRAAYPEMSGHLAMRHLLHLTRYATTESAVPDLGLPAAEFEIAATDAMLSWVRAVAAIDAADLRLAEGSEHPISWVDLRPVRRPGAVQEVDALFRTRIEEALRPTAEAGRPTELYFAEDLLEAWVSVLTVMPVGRATARFWLNRTTRHLVYIVRVAEHRADTDEPSYDIGTVPLDAEAMAELEAAMIEHPLDRLAVFRFADLAEGVAGRQAGMNVIVFQLGDWIHVQPRGWRFGTVEVDPGLDDSIRVRLRPPPEVRMEAAMLDRRGGAAGRTAAWLARDAEPWHADVGAAAADVRDHDGSLRERAVSRQLVELVLGDPELAEGILRDGLRALVRHDVSLRSAAYRVLHDSGRAPVSAGNLALDDDDPLRELLACGADGWDVVSLTRRTPVPDEEST